MYELLIVLRTQERIVIPKVVGYGILKEKDVFYFDKEKTRNFIPVHNVLYFGLNDLWPTEEDYEEKVEDETCIPIGFISATSSEDHNEGE